MYKLYSTSGACSMAVHAVLNEINVPFEVTMLTHAEMKEENFLKLNPRGQVPVLVDDGFVIREGAAIITYLCDTHGFPYWPQSGHGRATALQWLAYCNATLHPLYGRFFWMQYSIEETSELKTDMITKTCSQIQTCWDELNQVLSHTTYLCGEQPSPADFLMATIANWTTRLPVNIYFGDNLQRTLNAIAERASFKKTLESENVTYKIAA